MLRYQGIFQVLKEGVKKKLVLNESLPTRSGGIINLIFNKIVFTGKFLFPAILSFPTLLYGILYFSTEPQTILFERVFYETLVIYIKN